MDLKKLGWNLFFSACFEEFQAKNLAPARISAVHRNAYEVFTEFGEFPALITGKMIYAAGDNSELPAVGDWVAAECRPEEGQAIIRAVLPRKGKMSRKIAGEKASDEQVIAANVDIIFIVTSLNEEFSERRIERYVAAAYEAAAKPVIILNKSDLCADIEATGETIKKVAPGVDFHVTSAISGTGTAAIGKHLGEGVTAVFTGSSGVGKSTIINELAGREIFAVREISDFDDRGKHTTTHRQMVLLQGGGIVIDTPGMREFHMGSAGEGLREAFSEIEEFSQKCRFRDCTHDSEPGCAIIKAIEEGKISQERYDSYLKLQREIRSFNIRHDYQMKKAEQRKWKSIAKTMRHFKKPRP